MIDYKDMKKSVLLNCPNKTATLWRDVHFYAQYICMSKKIVTVQTQGYRHILTCFNTLVHIMCIKLYINSNVLVTCELWQCFVDNAKIEK